MNKNNSRNFIAKAAGFLSVASIGILISLPGLAQQAPVDSSTPSVTTPTNPGAADSNTTNGGEELNRVPQQETPSQMPTNGSMNGGMMTKPSSTPYNGAGANQPGATTGGDASQQVQQNSGSTIQRSGSTMQRSGSTMQRSGSTMQRSRSGSTMQRRTTTTQQTMPANPRQRMQSDTNSDATTDGTSTTQQQPSNGGVRALW